MTNDVIDKYKLTESLVERWCKNGCSILCDPLLKTSLKRKKVISDEVCTSRVPRIRNQ